MKIEVPVERESTISELIEAICDFRRARPKPESADMVERLNDMLELYNQLGPVLLDRDEKKRRLAVRILHQFYGIKQLIQKSDWNALAHRSLLYPIVGPGSTS